MPPVGMAATSSRRQAKLVSRQHREMAGGRGKRRGEERKGGGWAVEWEERGKEELRAVSEWEGEI